MVRKTSWWNASGTALRMTSRNWPMSRAIRSSIPSRRSVARQLGQHLGRGDVDERAGLGVEHDDRGSAACAARSMLLPDVVAVGEEQPGLHPDHQHCVGSAARSACRSTSTQAPPAALASPATCGRDDPVEQQQHRHRDADDQAGQGVEDQHAEHRGDGGERSRRGRRSRRCCRAGRSTPGTAGAARGKSTSSITAAITTAARVGLRQLLEQAGQEQQGDHRQHGHHQAADLGPGARAAVDRGLGQAAVDDHARSTARRRGSPRPARAAPGWRRSGSPALAAYVFAAPRPSANPIEQHADRRPGQVEVVRPGRPRRADRTRGRPDSIVADDLAHPLASGRTRATPPMPSSTATSEPGHQRQPAAQHQHHGQAQRADQQGQPAGSSPRWVIRPQVCSKKSPLGLRHAEAASGTCPIDDRQRQADDEALQHRLGDERRDEAQPDAARRAGRGPR